MAAWRALRAPTAGAGGHLLGTCGHCAAGQRAQFWAALGGQFQKAIRREKPGDSPLDLCVPAQLRTRAREPGG
jgi:hypothetical protein